jgi:hypothetical protein
MDKKDILKKVLKDEPKGFRKKFLSDPKKALEDISGKSLGNWKVEIHRSPKNTIVFNLPEELPSPANINDKTLKEIAAAGEFSFMPKENCPVAPDLQSIKPCTATAEECPY